MPHLISFILKLRIQKTSLHPVLPRYRQPPRRPGTEGAAGHAFSSPESYFRKEYFEVLDMLANKLKRRFQQKNGLPMAAMIETLLVTAANSTSIDLEIPKELHLYENDVDLSKLKTQVQMLPDLVRTRNVKVPNCIPIKSEINVRTICEIMNEINISKEMLSEVLKLKLLKIFYTIPVTTSSAERTFSALRRLEIYVTWQAKRALVGSTTNCGKSRSKVCIASFLSKFAFAIATALGFPLTSLEMTSICSAWSGLHLEKRTIVLAQSSPKLQKSLSVIVGYRFQWSWTLFLDCQTK